MSRRIIIAIIVLVLVVAGIIWFASSRDNETLTPVLSVSATNQTKNKPAADQTANAGDVIVYTLTAENQEDEVIEGYVMEVNISEITNSASLVDASGAAYNAGTNSLVWTPMDIPANESIAKQFSVRVNPLNAGSTGSTMKVRFNNEIAINVSSTPSTSGASQQPGYIAPTSGPSEWIAVMLAIIATISFLAIRKYRIAKV
jgi:hypothetical protein